MSSFARLSGSPKSLKIGRAYAQFLLAREALIFSRVMREGSNSTVIRFENALISASITPVVFRSFSSKNEGRSASFVPVRSRIPLARRPAGTAAVTPFLAVPDCTIIFATDCYQGIEGPWST